MAEAEDWICKAARMDSRFSAVAEAIRDCSLPTVNLSRPEAVAERLQLLAEDGNNLCRRLLATLYRHGIGVPKDGAEAEELLIQAAEDGSLPAMRTLAENRQYGFGVEKDLQLALQWYNRAVQRGDAVAMRMLAELYMDGIDGQPDPDLAVHLYETAAQLDDDEAAYRLAEHYLAGALPCDPEAVREKARALLAQAAQSGHLDAQFRLANMENAQ